MNNPLFHRLVSKVQNLEDIEWFENYEALEARKEAMSEREGMIFGRRLWLGMILLAVVLTILLNVFGVDASTPQYWMYLREGAAGLDFHCTDTPVYADASSMTVQDYTPFALNPQDLVVYAKVVEVEHCNLDVIYENDGADMFVWRFTERVTDGEEAARHFTRGAAWIQLLDFDRNLHD